MPIPKKKAVTKIATKTKEKSEKKVALINIWDDYFDDDFIPKGEKQETHIYLEDLDVTQKETKAILSFLLSEIKSLKTFSKVKFSMSKYKDGSPKIKVVGLNHVDRVKLLSALKKKKSLRFEDWVFDFISES